MIYPFVSRNTAILQLMIKIKLIIKVKTIFINKMNIFKSNGTKSKSIFNCFSADTIDYSQQNMMRQTDSKYQTTRKPPVQRAFHIVTPSQKNSTNKL